MCCWCCSSFLLRHNCDNYAYTIIFVWDWKLSIQQFNEFDINSSPTKSFPPTLLKQNKTKKKVQSDCRKCMGDADIWWFSSLQTSQTEVVQFCLAQINWVFWRKNVLWQSAYKNLHLFCLSLTTTETENFSLLGTPINNKLPKKSFTHFYSHSIQWWLSEAHHDYVLKIKKTK